MIRLQSSLSFLTLDSELISDRDSLQNTDVLKVSSCISFRLLKAFIDFDHPYILNLSRFWDLGRFWAWFAIAGWAHFGPDATASIQAWHWDICGAQAHQLLSLCHRQLYLNIHTKCRLMCICLAPCGAPSNRPN